MQSLIERIVGGVTEATFFRELCFTRQILAPNGGESRELADVLIWLETSAIVIQVKERRRGEADDPASLQRWFDNKVRRKGSKQIADTLSYLRDHAGMVVRNARGREFKLADLTAGSAINVVAFGSLDSPTELHRQTKLYLSRRSGAVHFVEALDFRNLLQLVVTPGEMLRYLQFRELYLRRHPFSIRKPEKWLFGRYVQDPNVDVPGLDIEGWNGEAVVDTLTNDIADVDLRFFFDHIGSWASKRDGGAGLFYKFALELAHLPRALMREFKRRIVKCQTRLRKPMPETLYRILHQQRDCTFVFGVLPAGSRASAHNWAR